MAEKNNHAREAEQLVAQGKYEKAIEVYRVILNENPKDTSVLNAIGDLKVRISKGEEAVPFFRRAAEVFEKSGFRKKAIATLRKAHRQRPNDRDVVMNLADLHVQEGLIGEAKSLLLDFAKHHHSMGSTTAAREAFAKVLEIDPRSIPALLNISELAAADGDTEAEFSSYVSLGKELINVGKASEALKLLEQAHSSNPDHVEVTKLYADLVRIDGDLNQAQKLYQELLGKEGDDADVLAALGEIALDSGDRERASSLFHRAQESGSGCERVALLGGRIAATNDDFDTALRYIEPLLDQLATDPVESPAVKTLEKMAARAGNHLPVQRKLVQVYTYLGDKSRLISSLNRLADALEREKEYDEAIEVSERLQGLEPDVLSHKARLDRLFSESKGSGIFGSPDATGRFTREELEMASGGLEVKRILLEAYVFLRYGLREKAKERVTAGLSVLAEDPKLHERLASIQREDGEREAAIESYRKAAAIWQRQGNMEKARSLRTLIAEISPPPVPTPAPKVAEPEIRLAEKIAEVNYYLEQRFTSAAHRVLSELKRDFPDNEKVEELWQHLRSQVSVELDSEEVGKEVDSFFEELRLDGAKPAAEAAEGSQALMSISAELEEELYALHSAAEERRGSLGTKPRKFNAERILSHLPSPLRRQAEETSRVHFDLGAAYMETGLLEEAIVEFQLAAEDPLYDQRACLQLGVCFRRRGMEGTAVEWLQRGITAGGDERVMADLLYQLTLAYEAQGKEGARNAALEQLKNLAPDHPGLVEFDSNES